MKRLPFLNFLNIGIGLLVVGGSVGLYYIYLIYKEPVFGLDCHYFSNGVMIGAPPEYRRHSSIKDGLNQVDGKLFSVDFPSFSPKNYPTKEEKGVFSDIPRLELLLFQVKKSEPGYIEKSIGPNPIGNLQGFNVFDGEFYDLERWQLPPSNNFRNLELYKYISETGYVDSVIIQCDKKPINVEEAKTSCQMTTEYEQGIVIHSNFQKTWLPKWQSISNGLSAFLNEQLINQWGQQCRTLI